MKKFCNKLSTNKIEHGLYYDYCPSCDTANGIVVAPDRWIAGTKKYLTLAEMARKGGKSTSEAKKVAARINGKLGGASTHKNKLPQ